MKKIIKKRMFYVRQVYNCYLKLKNRTKTYKMLQTKEKKAAFTNTHSDDKSKLEKWYSEDELNNEIIQAYKNFAKNLRKEIEENLEAQQEIAKQVCEKIYYTLNAEKAIKCKKVYLRTNSLIAFEAIVVIPEKAFLSDAFNKAYEISFEIAQGYQKNDFNFDFNFMPSTRHINSTALLVDGFNLSYEPIKTHEQEVKSRTA